MISNLKFRIENYKLFCCRFNFDMKLERIKKLEPIENTKFKTILNSKFLLNQMINDLRKI